MVVTKRETLNHENHGAYYAQVWKGGSIVPSLFFSHFFGWALWPLFFRGHL